MGQQPLGEPSSQGLPLRMDWRVVDGHHLNKTYTLPNFVTALAFVNGIGEVAEGQNHHPNIQFTWGKVEVDIWTHKIDGLTESDFIFAAKASEQL